MNVRDLRKKRSVPNPETNLTLSIPPSDLVPTMARLKAEGWVWSEMVPPWYGKTEYWVKLWRAAAPAPCPDTVQVGKMGPGQSGEGIGAVLEGDETGI